MPATTYVFDRWTSYRTEALRDGVPPGPLLDMQSAFYAGAAALYSILSQICFSDVPTTADVRKVAAIKQEILDFAVFLSEIDHKVEVAD